MRSLLVSLLLFAFMVPAVAQWRDDRYGNRGWGDHHHYGPPPWHRPPPPPQGGGGIDVGAIIGGIVDAFGNRSAPSQDMIAYCMGRYRSYNPETGIYYGYDGRPRRCP